MKELSDEVRKFIAFDEAMGKLKEAGLADAFIHALEHDPETMKAVEKLAPKRPSVARAGWSCCITVSKPLD
jgi:hypothetical protein